MKLIRKRKQLLQTVIAQQNRFIWATRRRYELMMKPYV